MGQWNSCEAQVFIVEEAQLEFDTPWMRFGWTIGKLQVAAADASFFFPLQIKPVQKQTRAGQRTRFKAVVIIGDSEGHIGLGIKTSKEVATAIRAAITIAKLAVLPVRRGYWGSNLGEPHSLPVKQSAKCGSVSVRVCHEMRDFRK